MTAPLNVLSLFSGIGGLDLGLERAGMTTVGQVELDPYCRRVLAKHWPDVPRHADVRTAAEWWLSTERPTVDVICGGFPCQDISNAGKQAGIIHGERSSLWTFMVHTVRVLRPRYVLMENVAAIVVRGLDTVAADLHEIGYDLEWDCIPAAAVGAPHRRDRWWGVAYPDTFGLHGRPRQLWQSGRDEPANRREDVAHPDAGHDGASRPRRPQAAPAGLLVDAGQPRAGIRGSTHWLAEPGVGRVADGVPSRLDRGRALGNAVVPQVSEYVGRLIVNHAESVAA